LQHSSAAPHVTLPQGTPAGWQSSWWHVSPVGAQRPQLGLQQEVPVLQKLSPHGSPLGWQPESGQLPAATGAHTPQAGLQQISIALQVVLPHGEVPAAQVCAVHAAPKGAQMPQLGLQQYSPAAHVTPPQAPPPQAGARSEHWPISLHESRTGGSTQLTSDGSHRLQGAPHGLPSHRF
jgi:hypothetical protein